MGKNIKTIRLVWMDLEMSGLDPVRDQILEIATVVTDTELKILARGPELVIRQPENLFETMDDWNRKHHARSGLWKLVVNSKTSLREAEEMTLKFLQEHTESQKAYLAGNSIWQDRRFLIQHMPAIDKYMHYRMLDVSSFKLVRDFWYKKVNFKKANAHRALQDIEESIAELDFYRKEIFHEPLL